MDESEVTKELVFKRYHELAGLVRDGQMVNKDKETRAREYVRLRKKFVEEVFKQNEIKENSKYGRFILQTNEVQFYLVKLIFLRSFNPTGNFEKELERLQLGALISYLNVCAQNDSDLNLITDLKSYKDKRDALAHKMFSAQKLTINECENGIKIGDKIIQYLVESLKSKQKHMIKGSDKISDFPKKFNELANLVESIKDRLEKLEKSKK
ncbi:MAG: hypothetical protein AAB513_01735 [Patescibacteria group bacterium]